tara:strand:+ start:4050 stop:4685 length:636 start_codon:yes stop_codon:yes gene_type:complete
MANSMAMQRRRFGRLGITDGAERYYQSNQNASDGTIGTLPVVDDPEKTFAAITRGEYEDYVRDYRDFEKEQIEKATTDTSLIDSAREDATTANRLAGQVAERNLSRYGANLTPAQRRQQQRGLQRASTLGSIQALSDARIAQREANQALLSDLINIGQDLNRSSQSQLGSAAGDANQRKQAYDQAKAQSKAQTYSMAGSLASSAIIAAFLI